MSNIFVKHTKEYYEIEGKQHKVENALTEDFVAFIGICHAIHLCQQRRAYGISIESKSFLAVKWVKEESIPIETERTKKAIKYLKSIPTKRTVNIEHV